MALGWYSWYGSSWVFRTFWVKFWPTLLLSVPPSQPRNSPLGIVWVGSVCKNSHLWMTLKNIGGWRWRILIVSISSSGPLLSSATQTYPSHRNVVRSHQSIQNKIAVFFVGKNNFKALIAYPEETQTLDRFNVTTVVNALRFLQHQKAALSTTISNVSPALYILPSRVFNVYLIGVKAKCNISKNLELARPTFSRQITSSNIRRCEVEATGFSRSPPFLTKFSPHDLGLGIVQQCTKMARWRWEVGLGRQMVRLTECYGALALFGSLLPISDLLLKIGERCWNVIIHPVFAFVWAIYWYWTSKSINRLYSCPFVQHDMTEHLSFFWRGIDSGLQCQEI